MHLERLRSFAFAGLAVTALAAGAILFVPHGADGQPAPQPPPSAKFACNGFTGVTVSPALPADINSAAGQQGTDC
ncbi:MAG: hypothetical protein JWM87_1327, partial [Candidatus Eremiobacteraeota bacterium]|nr:hypothetical protein [Candidatus Eremiobacteraeota bacterium]